uniref:BapA prefix-like domain-containing protein n=1 Tax=Knufia peltigerae TaxID=1002370 RepID=A0AA38X9F9_9EURO|nr:hypothetical protein H2204_015547 [Knufia peltigerae]
MAIRVKVVPVSETISADTPATTVANNVVVLRQSSDVALNIDPDQVAGYVKDGQDLVVQLKSGESVRIANFHVDGQAPSQLFLVDEEKLVAVDLPAAASDGPLAASYLPQDTPAGFDSMTAAGAATTGGGVGGAMILGGLAAVGAAVALASSGGDGGGDGGGGGTSPPPPAPTPPDTTAPSTPTALAVSADGRTLTGRGEAGATVRVDSNGDGRPDATGTVGADGRFSITLSPPLTNGEQITVTLADAAGNVSGPGQVTAPDTTPPAAATNVVVADDGSSVSGNGEPGATVGVDTNGDGQPDITGVVGSDGQFTLPLDPSLTNGETVSVVVTDPAGNSSPPVSVQAPDYPDAPLLDASNGSVISGTAGAGLTIVLTDGDGNPIGQTVADANGDWSFTPPTPLPDGTVVNAIAQDSAGNNSPTASTTVDAVAPAAPVVDPSNGVTISGTAEAGATVTLIDGSGNPIGQVVADGSGNWSFTPGTPLADGTVVNATATDAAGNTSGPGSATVDAVPPAVPTVDLSNGSSLSGTAEPGSTVTLTDGSGNPIGQVIADGSGNWSFTPGTPLADGTVVNVVAEDAAGNSSPAATVTVDASAPAAPVLNASNGSVISGTAEAGATVTLTDGSGNPIGQVTADGSGNWSFTPGTPLANGTVIVATATDPTGNTGPQAATTVDAMAPAAPVVDPSNGVTISGTAEAGATVILTDGGGNPIGQVVADGSGNWSFTPATPLANGTVVNAVVQDAAGNIGPQATTTVDSLAPAAPVVNPSNGNVLAGTAEANSSVTLTDGSGNPIGQVIADGSGNWTFTPAVQLANGTVVNATATDAAGNTSPPGSTTVDASLPSIPQVDPSNGSVISGTADAGNTIIITDGGGNPIGQVTADGSGNWSFTPGVPLPDGTLVNVVARSPGGTDSAPAVITVDGLAPAAPVIDPSNGAEISGTAEAGATVILTDGGGNPIGQAVADGSGNWSFTPGTPLADGTVINAVAQDPAGNTSGPASTTVDALAPATPVIAPSNGTVISGTAEAGATVILTDGGGNPIGQATADGSGNWSFTPGTPLADGTVINAVAQDLAGNTSGPVSTTVDSVAPAAPVIDPSNGAEISGTAEAGATVILTDGGGNPIGQAVADGSGNWSFTPGTPLADGTDPAGNTSGPASTTVDTVAPTAPLLSISADGALLTGTAEPNSQVRIVVNGDTANAITVNVDGSGNFTLPFSPALVTGELIVGVAVDAAGNISGPATINAPDLAPPAISVPESVDTWINAAEIGDGIQVDVTVRPTMQVGQVVTVKFAGQNGYEAEVSHTLTAGDIAAGTVTLTLTPPGGQGPFPEGASTITADINGGAASAPVAFNIDTVPPATPVLSVVGNLLTISAEPGTELTVTVNVGGVTATATVTADNSGLASLNLLTDLDIDFGWDQLLNAQVGVVGRDPAGNPSNVASIGVGTSIEQPVTIGNFGVDVSLNPLDPRFGLSGTTEPNSSVVIRVITPALNVELLPIQADASGNFSLNLLSPSVLTQLGLNITDILNLGSQISFNVVSTDTNGNDSAAYGITLSPNGLSLNIGEIDVNGTSGDDVLSGADGSSEHINGSDGSDLIFNVGTGDHVVAGTGNDTVQITATNFVSIDGGDGFDTLLLANGIDLDYNAVGVGTLSNIERVDLGTGDSGSVLTLTAAEVDAITDGNNTLQITGESNDTLNVVGAVDTGTTQLINGITYDVYTFGSTTLLVEDNTVQVVA